MKKLLLHILIAACLISSIGIFLFSCFATLTDAQGVFIFIFTLPTLIVLLAISYFVARKYDSLAALFVFYRRASLVLALAYGSFLVAAPIPYLNAYPTAVLETVGSVFEKVTGETPYAWVRKSSHVNRAIETKLNQDSQTVDFDELKMRKHWDRVCFLPPYTDAAAAKKIVNADLNIAKHSNIATSDSVTAIVLLNGSEPVYIDDLSRSVADFADLMEKCYPRDKAVFRRKSEGLPVFEHRRSGPGS